MDKKLHVVLVTPGFAKNEADTTCITALQLYVKSISSIVDISIVAIQYPYTDEPYSWNGIPVIPLNGKNKRWKNFLWNEKKLHRALDAIAMKNGIDILHSFWLQNNSLWTLNYAKKLKIPTLITAMGQEGRSASTTFTKLSYAPHKIISLSRFHQAECERNLGLTTLCIPWGTEIGSTSEKTIDFICVGNLVTLKNQAYFIELLNTYKEKTQHDFSALIIGLGPLKVQLENQLKKLNLQANIVLTGELSYPETISKIRATKVLVHPSHYESFGMIISEALANGTPVLASPVGIAFENDLVSQLTFDMGTDVELLISLHAKKQEQHFISTLASCAQAYTDIYLDMALKKLV